jgi:phosphatidylethanolamine/phosphatidyl-N-methylethanolamine N-methyltransferase
MPRGQGNISVLLCMHFIQRPIPASVHQHDDRGHIPFAPDLVGCELQPGIRAAGHQKKALRSIAFMSEDTHSHIGADDNCWSTGSMNRVRQHLDLGEPDAVRAAYARLSTHYDCLFGPILNHARRAAVAAVNRLPSSDVLEVGVGTGLALPHYNPEKHITGIDVSSKMLLKARERTARLRLHNVESLLEMDAQTMDFAPSQFDIAVAMFVASVVPNPRALIAELYRVVKPGGSILFVNHFAQDRGFLRRCEHAIAPISVKLGWHSDFRLSDLFSPSDLTRATIVALRPFGFFRLVELKN